MIAKRTGTIDGSGNLSTGTLTYTLSDHLGSTTREVQSDGTLSSAVKYWPFGAARDYTTPPERGYTGQQKETTNSTGLYYYHARFYSTDMGRFVSPDPVTSDGLNRYLYVRGNPLNLSDPTGYCAWEDEECTPTNVLSFLRCAFYGAGACGGAGASEEMRANLYTLSLWVIRQASFFHSVVGLANQWGNAFLSQVRAIRRLDPLGSTAFLRASYTITGVDEYEDGNKNAVPAVTIESDSVAGLVEYFIDYSYIDFRIGAKMTLWHSVGGNRSGWDEHAINSNFWFSVTIGGFIDAGPFFVW